MFLDYRLKKKKFIWKPWIQHARRLQMYFNRDSDGTVFKFSIKTFSEPLAKNTGCMYTSSRVRHRYRDRGVAVSRLLASLCAGSARFVRLRREPYRSALVHRTFSDHPRRLRVPATPSRVTQLVTAIPGHSALSRERSRAGALLSSQWRFFVTRPDFSFFFARVLFIRTHFSTGIIRRYTHVENTRLQPLLHQHFPFTKHYPHAFERFPFQFVRSVESRDKRDSTPVPEPAPMHDRRTETQYHHTQP